MRGTKRAKPPKLCEYCKRFDAIEQITPRTDEATGLIKNEHKWMPCSRCGELPITSHAQWASFHSLWLLLYTGERHPEKIFDPFKRERANNEQVLRDVETGREVLHMTKTDELVYKPEIKCGMTDYEATFKRVRQLSLKLYTWRAIHKLCWKLADANEKGDKAATRAFTDARFTWSLSNGETAKWLKSIEHIIPVARRYKRVAITPEKSTVIRVTTGDEFREDGSYYKERGYEAKLPRGIKKHMNERSRNTYEAEFEYEYDEETGEPIRVKRILQWRVNSKDIYNPETGLIDRAVEEVIEDEDTWDSEYDTVLNEMSEMYKDFRELKKNEPNE